MSNEPETCQATTAGGDPCQNDAGDDGYCWMDSHGPADGADESDPAAAAADAAADAEPDAPIADEPADGHVTPGQRHTTITVRCPEGGTYGGHAFSRNGVKQVAATESIKQALRRGKLQKIR